MVCVGSVLRLLHCRWCGLVIRRVAGTVDSREASLLRLHTLHFCHPFHFCHLLFLRLFLRLCRLLPLLLLRRRGHLVIACSGGGLVC